MQTLKEKLKRALEKLIILLTKQVKILQEQLENKRKREEVKTLNKNELIYQTAKSYLGKKIITTIPELGCAQAVNFIFIKAVGEPVGGTTSTLRMYNILRKEKKFKRVYEPIPGDLIISPTGKKLFWSRVKHGHVGIIGEDCIYSNNSDTGLFDDHWSIGKWLYYYGEKGGYLVEYFRLV